MKTIQNNRQNAQSLDGQIGELIKEAEKINQAIRDDGRIAMEEIGRIIAKIDESVGAISQSCSNLGQAEKDAADKIDQIILKDAEYLADNG